MKKLIAGKSTISSIDRIIHSEPGSVALVGQRGAGKLYAAEYIASQVLAIDNPNTNPYFIVLNAEKSGIENVRELQKKLILKVASTQSVDRVVVIEHFDSFGHEAQNSLLKTLEEPPAKTMILLTVDTEDNVLPTIFSRVQSVAIPPISLETAKASFSSYTPAQIERAYLMSGGTVGLMHGLLENDSDHELIKAIAKARQILQTPKFVRLGLIDSLTKDKELPALIVLDAIVRLLDASYRQAIQAEKPKVMLQKAHMRLQLSVEAIDDIQNGLNQKLALTRLFAAL